MSILLIPMKLSAFCSWDKSASIKNPVGVYDCTFTLKSSLKDLSIMRIYLDKEKNSII